METCQSIIGDDFLAVRRLECEEYVHLMQMKLDKAVAKGDMENLKQIVKQIVKSKAVKIVSTYRVTSNDGADTAGVDGDAMHRETIGEKNYKRAQLANRIDISKPPDSIRRVFIPKPNGEQRPLGIPTLIDRIIQDVVKTAIEPIAEYHFNYNSWGFRPKQSCHDAISHIFRFMSGSKSPEWVIEGDIKGCFDHINHEHVLSTLREWHVPMKVVEAIQKMLQTDIMEYGMPHESEEGTPQGGVISPLLANIALNALDSYMESKIRRYMNRQANPLVRYADDFIITCRTEQEATRIKLVITNFLRDEIGLTLSEDKTKITHISKGFNFLGFNIRKYKGTMLIKPQKEKVLAMQRRIKGELKAHSGKPLAILLRRINPMVRGFAIYYRFAVSSETFQKMNDWLWHALYQWCKKQHPDKSEKWVFDRYVIGSKKGQRRFKSPNTDEYNVSLYDIPIKRFVILRKGMRVYDSNETSRQYWEKRQYQNALNQIYSIKVERLYQKQNGNCPTCERAITAQDIADSKVDAHHLVPRSQGGKQELSNLQLLHFDCHQLIHSIYSRPEMKEWYEKGLKYWGKKAVEEATQL